MRSADGVVAVAPVMRWDLRNSRGSLASAAPLTRIELPLAAACLDETQWQRIAAGFEAVNDQLSRYEQALAVRRLYRLIAARAPAAMRGFLEEAIAA